jgi:hypothetical protein
MNPISLTKRPLLDRVRRMWALTQEGPEPTRIIHALMLVNLEVPELLTELDRVQQENNRLRAGLASLRTGHAAAECVQCWDTNHPLAERGCTCGADEHNARIDALLAERG